MFNQIKNYLRKSVNAFMSIKAVRKSVALVPIFFMAIEPAFANFTKANNLLSQIETGLKGFSLVVVTIAILVAGYKIIFQGQTFREVAPILIGGIVIGSASTIALIFVA